MYCTPTTIIHLQHKNKKILIKGRTNVCMYLTQKVATKIRKMKRFKKKKKKEEEEKNKKMINNIRIVY